VMEEVESIQKSLSHKPLTQFWKSFKVWVQSQRKITTLENQYSFI
jgi:hypothetical protein